MVETYKMSTEEALALIAMLKTAAEKIINFPNRGERLEFDVVGEKKRDEFVVNITRSEINSDKCTYQGRTKGRNQVLMRLDIGATLRHSDAKSGEHIIGSHLHIYDEHFDLNAAVPFDFAGEHLIDTCMEFFKRFNIVDLGVQPYQETLGI